MRDVTSPVTVMVASLGAVIVAAVFAVTVPEIRTFPAKTSPAIFSVSPSARVMVPSMTALLMFSVVKPSIFSVTCFPMARSLTTLTPFASISTFCTSTLVSAETVTSPSSTMYS